MKIKKLLESAFVAGLLAFVAVPANAIMTLELKDMVSNATVTLADGDNDGVVSWFGAVGGWSLNITSSISNSPGQAGDSAFLDLNSVNRYTGGGVGTIRITAFDSGWTTPVGLLTARTDVGGTLSGGSTANFEAKFNGTTIASLGPYLTSSFNGTTAAEVNAVSGYGLWESATITSRSGAPTSSFDLITTVPEPELLGLFGLGLLWLGFLRRRKTA